MPVGRSSKDSVLKCPASRSKFAVGIPKSLDPRPYPLTTTEVMRKGKTVEGSDTVVDVETPFWRLLSPLPSPLFSELSTEGDGGILAERNKMWGVVGNESTGCLISNKV
jgi:hypothetical protein